MILFRGPLPGHTHAPHPVTLSGRDRPHGRQSVTATYASAWDALAASPEEAERLRLRAAFMRAIAQHLLQLGAIPTEQARRLGITLPRLDVLVQGRYHHFSLDALVARAARPGLRITIEYKAPAG